MLSPGGVGGGQTTGIDSVTAPWIRILTAMLCPKVGNLTWPPSWKMERSWKLVALKVWRDWERNEISLVLTLC